MFNDFNFSVDMVRLSTEIRPSDFQNVMDKFIYNPYVKYREMKQITAYRHNFYFSGMLNNKNDFVEVAFDDKGNIYQKEKDDSYSFWLGAEHNARPFSKSTIDIVVQYNPNKCKDSELLSYVLTEIFLNSPLTKVKEIDFAIDIPTNIKNIRLMRDFKSSYRSIDNGSDDLTYYMRKRGSNGHLKLYNKSRESKLNYDLTRYEITLKVDTDLRFIDCYSVNYELFPDLLILGDDMQLGIDSIILDGTERVLTWACIDKPEYLKELPYRRRKKIEGYIKTLSNQISFLKCNEIECTIYNYFNTLKGQMNIKN